MKDQPRGFCRPAIPWMPCLVLAAALGLAAEGAGAQDLPRGQELFEDQCQACHDDFQRPESRHVTSLGDLRKRIEAWGTHTGTGWKKEEVNDVLFYLNRMFYKFSEKAL